MMLMLNLINEHMFEGEFGLERETLRVTSDGKLSQTNHPFCDDGYFERDFCENQLELITPVTKSPDELMALVAKLDNSAKKLLLSQDEYLWMYSNPPRIDGEDEIQIAKYAGDKSYKHDYRIKLESRYGKRLMLYSGVHLNISFSERYLRSVCDETDFDAFKTNMYFRLFKQASRFSFIPVLLTASSPVYDKSLDKDNLCGASFDGYASRRNGEAGYWNKFIPILDYGDVKSYITTVQDYIDKGFLFSESELYMPVRLKPRGINSLDALKRNGANHIELRMFDVNPLSPVGFFKEDIEFTHYFLLYLMSFDDFDFTPDMQKTVLQKHKNASLYTPPKEIVAETLEFLSGMERYFKNFDFVRENIAYQKDKLLNGNRYCVAVYNRYHENYHEKMLHFIKGEDEKRSRPIPIV